MLQAEEAFQAHLLTDHAMPHTTELSCKNKGRKTVLREPFLGPLFPYLYCTTWKDSVSLRHITSAQKLSRYINFLYSSGSDVWITLVL